MTKSELEPILDQLIALGEDADELNYWRDIFEDLPEDKQQDIAKLYQEELTELKKTTVPPPTPLTAEAPTATPEPSPETKALQGIQQQALAYLDEVDTASQEEDHALADFASALDEEKTNEIRASL